MASSLEMKAGFMVRKPIFFRSIAFGFADPEFVFEDQWAVCSFTHSLLLGQSFSHGTK